MAAAGLSSFESDDYCMAFPREYTFTPPGWHCVPADLGPEGAGMVPPPDSGHWAGFLALTAAGLVLLSRRSKLAWATMLILATAGGAMFLAGGMGFLAALYVGVPLALLATRSLLATGVGLVALFLAMLPWFFSDTAGAVGSTLVLLLVALIPQRAEVMRERVVTL